MKRLIQLVLKSTAISLFAVLAFAPAARAATINVNFGNAAGDAMNGKSFIYSGYQQVPLEYPGTTWNDFIQADNQENPPPAILGSNLNDSTGATTAVGFTTQMTDNPNNFMGPAAWNDHPNVKMLNAGLYRVFNSGSGNAMHNRFTITGLTPGGLYHVVVVGCQQDKAAGEWGIGDASTAPASTQLIINALPLHEDWVANKNYAFFYRVPADGSGNIYVWGKGQPGSGGYAAGITLNGFQIADASVPSPEKNILSFTTPEAAGSISGTRISLTVPTGTDVTALVPTIEVSPGASVSPNTGVANNFTYPQTYTVTAENGSTKTYTVRVFIQPAIKLPPVTAGLARFFDASQLAGASDNAPVSTWPDLSGNAADATVPSGNANPTYVANAGTVSGLPALHFAPGSGAPTSGALRFTRDSSIGTVFSVFKGSSFLLTDANNYDFHRSTDNNPASPLWDSSNANANIRGGATYVNGALVDGTTYAMPTDLNNGFNLVEVVAAGTVQADSFNKDRVYHSGDQYQAEVIIYDQFLIESDRLLVEQYLMSKWLGVYSGLVVSLNSPLDGVAYPSGSSITATTTANGGTAPYTVTFYKKTGAGAFAQEGSPVTAPGPTFTMNLGALANNTYEIYASVTDSAGLPATASTATNTFTVQTAVPTATTLATSGSPSGYGQSVTFTATVSPTPLGGTVQFYANAVPLGTPVDAGWGTAQISTSTLPTSTNAITAVYSGFGVDLPSAAAALSQTVTQAVLTVTADNKVRGPGTANPPFTYQISGYKNGENATSAGVTGAPVLGTVANEASPEGTYPITNVVGTLSAPNYSFTTVPGTLTVMVGAVPVVNGLACWYDASFGVTNDGTGVLTWADRSGNGHLATRLSGTPTLVPDDVNSKPSVHLRGASCILDCAVGMFAKEQYVVVRSPNATWSGGSSGSFLGRKSSDFLAVRASSHNLYSGYTGFWDDQLPAAVSKNGTAVPSGAGSMPRGGFELVTITNYMILKIVVTDAASAANLAQYPYYQIGRTETLQSCDMDIAEIIAYSVTNSPADEAKIGAFLANKYGILTTYPDVSPQARILTFGVPGWPATIDQTAMTIALTVPYGYNQASLPAQFTLSTNATCTVSNITVHSGDPLNFTTPVQYTIKSSDLAKTNNYLVTVTVLPKPALPVLGGLACWYDAGVGVIDDGAGNVQTWQDQSGHGHHATVGTHGSPTIVQNDVTNLPAVHLRGNNNILDCAGAMFTKQQYVVVRSPNPTWNGNGSFLGRASQVFLSVRASSYNLASGTTGFWQDHFPTAVSKNGTPVAPGSGSHHFDLDPITDYMIVTITVDDTADAANLAAYPYYQIGQNETLGSCDMDIAEIVGYDHALSGPDEVAVGTYLAQKYGLANAYVPYYDIATFGDNLGGSSAVITTTGADTGTIAWTLPPWVDVTNAAPTYTVSPYAREDAAYPSGATRNFTGPVTYTITDAALTPQKTYTVTTTVGVYPPNNNFADAILLPGDNGAANGTGNVYATFEPGEPVCNYASTTNTVWFKWVCSERGRFTLATAGSTSTQGGEWDAVVGIYTGNAVNALTPVVFPAVDTGGAETVTVTVSAGTTYYIQLGGWPGPAPDAASDITLTWSFVTLPPPILVGASGSGTNTFDTGPSYGEWSTVSVGGGSGNVTSDATMDTAMNTIPASMIATALLEQADNTAQGVALYRYDLGLLETRVTGNTMTLLMATLQNTSGSTISLKVSYTMGLLSLTPTEQINGHRVYWSKTGAPGSWTAVGDFLLTAPGTLNVSFNLPSLAWANGELLYVVWADDNGTGTDGDFTIDNVSFTPAQSAPTITGITAPVNGHLTLSGVATGSLVTERATRLNPSDWTPIQTNAVSGAYSIEVPQGTGSAGFYRTRFE